MRRSFFISVLIPLVLTFTFYGGEVRAQVGLGYGGQDGPQYGPQYQQPWKPMEDKDAKAMLENYIQSTMNPNLKLGKIEEKDGYFEAEILTEENSLVDRLFADKFIGWLRSIY
jgi:hypothetical protein